MTMKYPEEEGDEYVEEEYYVCMTCFKEGCDAFILVKDADEEYPDWNKEWREKVRREWEMRKKRLQRR